MLTFLVWLHTLSLESQIDWLTTRYYRFAEWCNIKLWHAGWTDKKPASEFDLTELLNDAERKNKILFPYD